MTPFRYLSDEWLRAADAALAELDPVDGDLVVGFRVTGGPDGVSCHRVILGPERVGAERGLTGASVTMTLSWELAVDIARGRTSAQRAFLDGRIQLGGDPAVLLGYQRQLTDVDDRLAELRSSTRY